MTCKSRSIQSLLILGVVSLVTTGLAATPGFGEPVRVGHVEAELVAEVAGIRPATPFTVGLHLNMDEHWHVYWRNPGDAGLPPRLTWELPEGWQAGEIQWPYPERFEAPPLMSFGYHDEILLPVTITPPPDLVPGTEVTLTARAFWLVCREECIPGEADLRLILPVGETASVYDEQWADRFAAVRQKLPVALQDWEVAADIGVDSLTLRLRAPQWWQDSLGSVLFLPYDQKLIDNSSDQTLKRLESGAYEVVVKRSKYSTTTPDRVAGILIAEPGWRGPDSERAVEINIASKEASGEAAASTGGGNLPQALLFAFLGGIILNLMPCVLPVLSLKVLSLVKHAGESRSAALGHGLVFTAGVLFSFWLLAAVLLILRAGGEQLGWGFQLQSPGFLVVLSSFMFLFGLNLLGVFEMGGTLTAVGGRAAGRGGSFLTGVTATIVATPCTAPFMGSALGFSLSQPTATALLIFTALGLGMAAPYLVLAAVPELLRFVPRPGRWMETLKQVMGFLLLATVIWLAWVLSVQAGAQTVIALLAALLVLGIGAWVYGRWGGPAVAGGKRRIAQVTAVALLVGALALGLVGVEVTASTPVTAAEDGSGGIAWEPFSAARVDEATASGEAVFIDFTAAWCLSCKVNERVAFGSAEVQRRFDELGIVPLKADWTTRDDEITRALASYGRNSVPLYVVYGAGDDPLLLPEILTPGIVLDALDKIENQRR